jgi:hypothetical protein
MKNLIIVLSVFLMSCATLGSMSKIYNDAKVHSVKTVGLITKRFDQPRNPFHRKVKETFTRTLITELEKRDLFKIVLLDTMENENFSADTYVTDASVDALLIAEWKLNTPHYVASNASVKLSLLDKETKEVLITARHGTLLGTSYWRTPTASITIFDATVGAMNAMEKRIKLHHEMN